MIRRFQFSMKTMFETTTLLGALCANCTLAGGAVATVTGLRSAFDRLTCFMSFGEIATSWA